MLLSDRDLKAEIDAGRVGVEPYAEAMIQPSSIDVRLDRWFRNHFPDVGYGHLQKLLRSGQVRVNGKRIDANHRIEFLKL